MSFFEARYLCAGYGGKKVFGNIAFEMQSGSLVGVIGANGCGKTTLLKAICGIIPHRGECSLNDVLLEGLSPKKIARLCGYIPQRSGISISMPVIDVVLMAFNTRLGLLERPNTVMRSRAAAALEAVGLGGREEDDFLTLSEGQKQLCILARTLCTDASLLLLDEPESSLDISCRYRMLDIIKLWICKGERGAIVTLHDPMLALNYCDRLLLMSEGELYSEISPGTDDMADMEEKLTHIYGAVSLMRCKDRRGNSRLVMFRETNEDESSYPDNIF